MIKAHSRQEDTKGNILRMWRPKEEFLPRKFSKRSESSDHDQIPATTPNGQTPK